MAPTELSETYPRSKALPCSHQASELRRDCWSQGSEPLQNCCALPQVFIPGCVFAVQTSIHPEALPRQESDLHQEQVASSSSASGTKKWGTEPPIPHELMQSPCRDKTTLESMENPVVSLITECVSADLLKGHAALDQAAASVAPDSARIAVRMATGAIPIKTPREAPVQLSTTKTRLIPLNNCF